MGGDQRKGETEKEIEALECSVERTMEEAIEFAKESPELTVDEFLESMENY